MTLFAISIMALICAAVMLKRGVKPMNLDWSARITINPKQIFIMIAPGLDDDPLPGDKDPPPSEE